jgi:hypothetical protein
VCLFSVVKAENFSVRIINEHKLEVKKNNLKKIYDLKEKINRFEVNCEKSFITVAGIIKNNKVGELDYSKVSLINIDKEKEVISFNVSAGIFNIDFLGNEAKVNENYLINLESGDMVDPYEGNKNIVPESCNTFKYKFYGKVDSDGKLIKNP